MSRGVRITAADIEHGTAKGYKQHYRFGELPCEPCRDSRRPGAAHARALVGERH